MDGQSSYNTTNTAVSTIDFASRGHPLPLKKAAVRASEPAFSSTGVVHDLWISMPDPSHYRRPATKDGTPFHFFLILTHRAGASSLSTPANSRAGSDGLTHRQRQRVSGSLTLRSRVGLAWMAATQPLASTRPPFILASSPSNPVSILGTGSFFSSQHHGPLVVPIAPPPRYPHIANDPNPLHIS